jgi:formate hydrogenlyase transcriptional activator
VIAATNRDLTEMVESGSFREDLYYRLKVFPIAMPALRDRPEDIELLAGHFMRRFAGRWNKRIDLIPPDTLEAFRRHRWPGNVRELENLIQRAVIMSRGPVLTVPEGDLAAPRLRTSEGPPQTLEGIKRAHIVRVLEDTNWMVGGPRGAAVRLGLKRTTLQSLLKRLGIEPPAETGSVASVPA